MFGFLDDWRPPLRVCFFFQWDMFMCGLNCFASYGCMHHVCDQGQQRQYEENIPNGVLFLLWALPVEIWQAVKNREESEPASEIRPQCWDFRNNISLFTVMLYSRCGRIFLSVKYCVGVVLQLVWAESGDLTWFYCYNSFKGKDQPK